MIVEFRHKRLRLLFEQGLQRGLPADRIDKIENILAALDAAEVIGDMRLPGFRLHRLRGDRAGQWAVDVSANRRIVFRFVDGRAFDVDLVDYH